MVVKHCLTENLAVEGLRVVLSHMVVKQCHRAGLCPGRFESSVISYGSQTAKCQFPVSRMFESSVISYGSQTYVAYLSV